MMRLLFLCGVMLMIGNLAQAREWASWCGRDDLRAGFSFYCDAAPAPPTPSVPRVQQESPSEVTQAEPTTPPSAQEELARLQAELEEARAEAIMHPSDESVIRYMRLQAASVELASRFAAHWKRAIWQIPELDYTARHPQGSVSKAAVQSELRDARRITLAGLRETHGLIYVGSGNCAVCRAYGPMLSDIAERNGLSVLSVSLDDAPLHGFPQTKRDNGQLKKLGINTWSVPITALYDNGNKKVVVLGYGFIAESDLIKRIHALLKQEVGDAF